jgi:hypothetical protein
MTSKISNSPSIQDSYIPKAPSKLISKQSKDPLDVFHAVFGKDSTGEGQKLLGLLPCFVTSYLTKSEKIAISNYLTLKKINHQKIDLLGENGQGLKLHLGREALKEPARVEATIKSLNLICAPGRRAIAPTNGTQYGSTFPVSQALSQFLMMHIRGQNFMEWAAADGHNGIMAALAGASKVHSNDLAKSEVFIFNSIRENLPKAIQKRVTVSEGDCCKILEKVSSWKGKTHYLFIRNFLHFCNKQQQADLFQTIGQTMSVDGRVILTVTPAYALALNKEITEKHPTKTHFFSVFCTASPPSLDGRLPPCTPLFASITPIEGITFSLSNSKRYTIYTKKEGSNWKMDKEKFMKIDPSLRSILNTAIQEKREVLEKIPSGEITVDIQNMRCFTEENLKTLVESYGFEVECTFVCDREGNLTHRFHSSVATQVGIIFRKKAALK